MKCDGQISVKLDRPIHSGSGWVYSVPVNCGKCLNCKKNRVNQWAFRLMRESEVSSSAMFVTITYSTDNLPFKGKVMTLVKKPKKKEDQEEGYIDYSLQSFIKRLRYYEENRNTISINQHNIYSRGGSIGIDYKIKYYAVGEYGTKRSRPHYHLILFNVQDQESIYKAWTFGTIHIDYANNNTIDYTLKYMCKEKIWNWRDKYREKEFSLMSKGIGDNYIKDSIKKYYQRNLNVNYLVTDRGYKIPVPKYYRERILSEEQKKEQLGIIKKAVEDQEKIYIDTCNMYGLNPELIRLDGLEARLNILKNGQDRPVD